jgi:hypothetical protein
VLTKNGRKIVCGNVKNWGKNFWCEWKLWGNIIVVFIDNNGKHNCVH